MRTTLLSVVMLAAFVSPKLFAQSSTGPTELPAGSIDGAVTPELITDATAFRLFLTAVSLGPNPTQQERNRQAAKLRPIQLSAEDKSALLLALTKFPGILASAEQTPGTSLDDLAEATIADMRSQLSQDGFTRLMSYVQTQKKYMKRIPYPSMPGHE